jgi:endonuclease/exonuclease/phosphatase family metal-dependent hydrolase
MIPFASRPGTHPRTGEVVRGTGELRFASYNIHLGIGRDGIFRPDRIAAVIDELDADVVALQEVSLGGPAFNMLEYLSRKCALIAIAGPTLLSTWGEYGNAILTRLRHSEIMRWDLSVGGLEPRGAIDTRVVHGAHTLRVVATHLGLRPGERRRQIRRLLKIIEQDNRFPTVLLGDVNEWFLWGRPLRWMHRHFKRTPALPTFPAGRPLFALDRIWVEPRSALRRIAVHTSATARIASDHLPIVASLNFGLVETEPAAASTELATG